MKLTLSDLKQCEQKSRSKKARPTNKEPTEQELAVIRYYKNHTLDGTAKYFGISTGKVKRLLDRHKIRVRNTKEAAFLKQR